jgi:Flp pilus assembly protein TadG
MKLSTRRSRQRRGASAVEFAFVSIVFFMFMMGVFEFARYLFTQQLLNNAAREGARYAVVNIDTATTTTVQNYVDSYLAGQGGNALLSYSSTSSITVFQADPTTGLDTGLNWQNSTWGSGIGVSISGTYQPIVPGLIKLTGSLSVKATCTMTVEAN